MLKKIIPKLITLTIILVFIISSLISCDGYHDVGVHSDEFKAPWVLISVEYDNNNNVVQRILYNSETKLTYIYNNYYEYYPNSGARVCTDFSILIYDETGTLINN